MLSDRDLLRVQLSYEEFSRHLVRCAGPAGHILEEGGVLLCASSVAFPVLFNAAWRIDSGVSAAEVVDRADAWFGELGRGWSLSVRDTGADDDLRAAMEAKGMPIVMDSPEMVMGERPSDGDSPDGVELNWLHDRVGLSAFVEVNESAYVARGLSAGTVAGGITSLDAITAPHVHTVVAHWHGEPAAAAQVILSHGIALVCWVGTIPSARGHGLGDLVSRVVTQRAFDHGASFVSLQASEMGEPIYRRMGYQTHYRYVTFARLSTRNPGNPHAE